MMETKKQYLYLESDVFIFMQGKKGLLYDSLAGKSYEMEVEDNLHKILTDLLDLKNMYVVTVSQEELEDKSVKAFVDLIRTYFLGDLVPVAVCPVKPVLFPPVADFQLDKSDGEKLKNSEVLKNLFELTVYVTDCCEDKEVLRNANRFSNQTRFCRYNEPGHSLDIETLKHFFDKQPVRDIRIHLMGGDWALYPQWEELTDFFSSFSDVDYSVHYIHFVKQIEKWKNLKCVVLVDYPIQEDVLDGLWKCVQKDSLEVSFRFMVKDSDTFLQALSYQERYEGMNAELIPVYDDNWDFFYENICISEEDLQEICLSKKDIFRNQLFNTNFFGKLIIDSTGKIYIRLNEKPLGDIERNSLKAVVMKALEKNSSWFWIRNSDPCNSCLYQWLCPPPSTYESVTGKFNLCQISQQYERK